VVLRRTITRHLRFLQDSQWWSEDDLREYQNERLRALVRHAYDNVAYYRSVFDERKLRPQDVRTVHDLRKLPILRKEDIRRSFPDRIVAPTYPTDRVIPHTSSGSTGEPLQYRVSNDAYSFNIACNLRGWYWMGYRLGDRFVKISQYARPRGKRLQDWILRTGYVSSAELTDEAFRRIVDQIRAHRPKVLRCYPDPLFLLARYMEEHGIEAPGVDVVTTTGSVLLPQVRALVERQFDCPVFDSYRCEGGANAFESPTHDCYVSSMEYGVTEILDSDGDEVGEGSVGRLVTTDLHNYAMPFIRYDSQDVVTKHRGKSKCGRQHLALTKIDGRSSDILVTPTGQYLIVIHFVDYFDQFDSIDRFQVRQVAADELVFLLKVNDRFDSRTEREIVRYWREYTRSDMSIEIERVAEIQTGPSGKRRFLVRSKDVPLKL